jgi:hypothetical protein
MNNRGLIFLIQPIYLIGTSKYKIYHSIVPSLKKCDMKYEKGTRFINIIECINSPNIIDDIKKIYHNKSNIIIDHDNDIIEGNEFIINFLFATSVTGYNYNNINYNIITNKLDNKNNGIIYFVQPAELIGTSRYKIGCSTVPNLNRITSGYKLNGTRYITIMECKNPIKLEENIKKTFNTNFKLIAGKEFFEGEEKNMINIFLQTVFEYNSILYSSCVDVDHYNNNDNHDNKINISLLEYIKKNSSINPRFDEDIINLNNNINSNEILITYLKTHTKIDDKFIDDFFGLYNPSDKYNFSISLDKIAKWIGSDKSDLKKLKIK